MDDRLSYRERQLIALAAEGLTDLGIANKLGIRPGTVNTYWTRIRAKVGQYSRVELVARWLAEQNGRAVAELRAEIERLRALQAEGGKGITDEFGYFRAVLEESPDAVLLIDENNRVAFSNHAAQRLFGYTEEEFLALSVQGLVPERYRASHSMHMAEYRAHPSPKRMGDHAGTFALHKDGHEFLIAASLSGIAIGNSEWIICSVRPSVRVSAG